MRDEAELQPGTITRIVRQKRNPSRVSIYLDGQFAFGLHQDVLLEYEIHKGAQLTVARQRDLLAADERLRARARAMDLIAYRSRSAFELRRRLLRDGFGDGAVEDAVERLRSLKLIDDRTFAAEYADSRFRNKGYGPRRIAAELRARGIDRTTIDDVLAAQFSDESAELDQAREFAARRSGRLSREPDPVRRRKKLYDALLRRGYSPDVIRQVIDEYAALSD